MVDLLKQKSKITMQHRERKTFAPADVFKQRKIQPADGQPPPIANKKQEESNSTRANTITEKRGAKTAYLPVKCTCSVP